MFRLRRFQLVDDSPTKPRSASCFSAQMAGGQGQFKGMFMHVSSYKCVFERRRVFSRAPVRNLAESLAVQPRTRLWYPRVRGPAGKYIYIVGWYFARLKIEFSVADMFREAIPFAHSCSRVHKSKGTLKFRFAQGG